jgi:hypothetical protein
VLHDAKAAAAAMMILALFMLDAISEKRRFR